MSKIVKRFLTDFTESLIPHRKQYMKLIRKPLIESIKYFALLIFSLNLLFFFLFLIKTNPSNIMSFRKSLLSALEQFPDDLTIYIRGGSVITTYNRPYMMWLDQENKKTLLLVVDETATNEDMRQYDSHVLLTGSSLVFGKTALKGQPRSFPLLINLTLNKNTANALHTVIGAFFGISLVLGIVFMFFIVPLIHFLYTGVILLFVSTVGYLIYNIVDRKHDHKKTLQLSLHASTLPLFVFYGINFINPAAQNVGFAFFFLSLIFTLCALYEAYIEEPSQAASRRNMSKTAYAKMRKV